MSELQGLQLKNAEFSARNTDILAIVVDPTERNAEVVAHLGLDFRILSDPELATIESYGVRHQDADAASPMARPATFLVDPQGIVRWKNVSQNYRYRPRPETILAEIERLSRG